MRYHVFAMSLFGTKRDEAPVEVTSNPVIKTIAWVSAGLGAVALGLLVGRELRSRYKFSHRTPYDAYAHAGDQVQDVECSVGI
jgi:hypothetical protein